MFRSFKDMWYEEDYVSFFGFAILIPANVVLVVVALIAIA